jgi:hypothetical protein
VNYRRVSKNARTNCAVFANAAKRGNNSKLHRADFYVADEIGQHGDENNHNKKSNYAQHDHFCVHELLLTLSGATAALSGYRARPEPTNTISTEESAPFPEEAENCPRMRVIFCSNGRVGESRMPTG